MGITPPRSRYQQVAEHLRRAITAGEYRPGQALPSESQLAQQFGLNRTTINKAIRQLVAEGLVVVEHGRGSYVREQRPVIHISADYVTRGADGWPTWTSELAREGLSGSQRIREVSVIDPPTEIAGRLGLEDGEQVVVRRRLLLIEDEPVQLADSYYPARIAADTELARRAKMRGGENGALERLGIQLGFVDEEVSARMPTPDEAGLLKIPQGTPVLRHVRVTYDRDGRPVAVMAAVMAADRFTMRYRLPTSTGGGEQE
ncbi:Transcriptional regulator [Carbonactinospora thermoautotrophica]|nr:GntR family transcriptional regulator [Carbonactinospora thermoautotrophica]KWX03204.1 Transcriptional regulator [Carbonactinospora thermoautotrophica]